MYSSSSSSLFLVSSSRPGCVSFGCWVLWIDIDVLVFSSASLCIRFNPFVQSWITLDHPVVHKWLQQPDVRRRQQAVPFQNRLPILFIHPEEVVQHFVHFRTTYASRVPHRGIPHKLPATSCSAVNAPLIQPPGQIRVLLIQPDHPWVRRSRQVFNSLHGR